MASSIPSGQNGDAWMRTQKHWVFEGLRSTPLSQSPQQIPEDFHRSWAPFGSFTESSPSVRGSAPLGRGGALGTATRRSRSTENLVSKKKWISLSPSSSPFMLLIALGWVAWHLSLLPWNKLHEGSDVVCLVHNSVPRAHHGDETRPGLKHTEREDLNAERHDCLLISPEATRWRGQSRVFGRSSHPFVHALIHAFAWSIFGTPAMHHFCGCWERGREWQMSPASWSAPALPLTPEPSWESAWVSLSELRRKTGY